MSFRVGIVGATGAVGQELVQLLQERSFPVAELRLLASSRSAGKVVHQGGQSWKVGLASAEAFDSLDLAIFSAGADISRELGPEAARRGCVVIDNSSAFRMEPQVPLVVPEVNGESLAQHAGIIANPNCSTAIAMMALCPLHRAFKLKRFFASTYQSASGAGAQAMAELEAQVRSWVAGSPLKVSAFPHQLAFNLIPQVDRFLDDGYTKEEHKMVNESRRILNLPGLRASTTCVRVPVLRAHSIAINAEFAEPVNLSQARSAIENFAGVELRDDPAQGIYPMPMDYSGRANCGVGRLRLDSGFDNGLSLWVVGDQLWKGAALNAVQIAERLVADGLISGV